MARIRSIHPGIFTDEAYMALSLGARELVKGIWCEADDHGVFEWKPNTLKARILPNDAVDVPALLAELLQHQFLQRLTADGREFGYVRNFCRWQRPKKPKYAHPLPQQFRTWVGLVTDSGEPVPHQLPTDDASPDDGGEPVPHQLPTGGRKSPQREEGGGKKEEEDSDRPPPTERGRAREPRALSPSQATEFEAWWEHWPNKVAKPVAARAFVAARAKATLAELIVGAQRYAARLAAPNAPHPKHPQGWLNDERWNDQPMEARNGHGPGTINGGSAGNAHGAGDHADFRQGLARAAAARMGPDEFDVPGAHVGGDRDRAS